MALREKALHAEPTDHHAQTDLEKHKIGPQEQINQIKHIRKNESLLTDRSTQGSLFVLINESKHCVIKKCLNHSLISIKYHETTTSFRKLRPLRAKARARIWESVLEICVTKFEIVVYRCYYVISLQLIEQTEREKMTNITNEQ